MTLCFKDRESPLFHLSAYHAGKFELIICQFFWFPIKEVKDLIVENLTESVHIDKSLNIYMVMCLLTTIDHPKISVV